MGFREQVSKWPVNPLDVIIKYIRSRRKKTVVADFGCGDAMLAARLPNTVHSFDLHAPNDRVVACDIANVPLADDAVQTAVFSLSLMGTNYMDFIMEARRVLQKRGQLIVAEVRSRFGGAHPDDVTLGHGGSGSKGKGKGKGGGKDVAPASDAAGVTAFVNQLRAVGFKLLQKDVSNKMFVMLVFELARKSAAAQAPTDALELKACQYKRR